MSDLISVFKATVFLEWISLVFLISGSLILVCLLRYSERYRKYVIASGKQEKMTKVSIVFRKIRIAIISGLGLTMLAFLTLWYLIINYKIISPTHSLLLPQFFLFSVLGLLPIPIAFLIFEYYLKIYLKIIKSYV